MAIIPTEDEEILIKFSLDGRIHWWPATILHYLPKCNSKQGQKTKAKVKYHTFLDYKEETGIVKFTKAFELDILDAKGKIYGSASWKLPGNTSSSNSEESNKTYSSTYSTVTPSHGHQPGEFDSRASVPTDSSKIRIDLPSRNYFELAVQRIDVLEHRLENISSFKHDEVWNGRVDAIKKLFKMKLLDYVKRPLSKPSCETNQLFYSSALRERQVRIAIDCDYELFSNIHRALKRDFSPVNSAGGDREVQFLPKSFSLITPTFFHSRVDIIFSSFDDLQAWMGITDDVDKKLLLFRSSTRNNFTASSVFGSLQISNEDKEKPVNVFIGQTTKRDPGLQNVEQISENVTTNGDVLHLGTGLWDETTMSFTNQWVIKKLTLPAYDLKKDDLCKVNYFGLVWEPRNIPGRSIWSAETLFNGSIILGTLSLVLPTVEFFNKTAVQVMRELSKYVRTPTEETLQN